jgi:hypothetical protein
MEEEEDEEDCWEDKRLSLESTCASKESSICDDDDDGDDGDNMVDGIH